MTELTIEALRIELAPIREELTTMRTHLDGLPFINRAIDQIRHEVRALRTAFNDFAVVQTTSGEIQALHDDVNRVMARNAELEVLIATLQRQVRELQGRA
jgi:hypothetical protein